MSQGQKMPIFGFSNSNFLPPIKTILDHLRETTDELRHRQRTHSEESGEFEYEPKNFDFYFKPHSEIPYVPGAKTSSNDQQAQG